MRRILVLSTALAVLGLGTRDADAQGRSREWSIITGRTVGADDNVLYFQGGWPGISAAFVHGVTPKTDAGGIFTFNYSFDGLVNLNSITGLKLQFLSRTNLADSPGFNVGFNFVPGLLFYFYRGATAAGITFPLGLAFGFPATSSLSLALTFELPMFLLFNGDLGGSAFFVPILFGGGIEYFIERNLAVTFTTKAGPMILIGNSAVQFDLQALIGLAVSI